MLLTLPLVLALVAAPAVAHDHGEARLFVIRSQLAQAGPNPIVFSGDSIVEATLLPAEICGHRVINAGRPAAHQHSRGSSASPEFHQ